MRRLLEVFEEMIRKISVLLRRLARDPLVWIVCGLALAYFGLVSLRPIGIFWSPDEGGKYIHVLSMIKSGNPAMPLEYPGSYLDREAQFVPLFFWSQAGGQIYSWWPVGFPLMTVPLYLLLGWNGLYVIPALSGALCALLAGLLTRQIVPQDRRLPVASALVTGLGTPIGFYSTTFWEHTAATACFLSAVLFAHRAWKTQRARWLVLSGMLASLATFLRIDLAAMSVGLGLALIFLNWRWSVRWGMSYVLMGSAWLYLNWHLMGHALGRNWLDAPGTLATAPLLGGIRDAGLWFFPYVLFNAPFVIALDLGRVVLVLATMCVALALVSPLLRRFKWASLIAYTGLAAISASVLFHPEGYRSVHGLVLIAPHVVFAIWLYTSPSDTRGQAFPLMLLGVCATTAILYIVRAWFAAGGLQWGPRYLLTLYPLLVVASVVGLARAWPPLRQFMRNSLVALYLVCVLIGVGYEVRGMYAALSAMRYYDQTRQAILQLDPKPVVTKCIWLGAVIPDLYWTGSVFALHKSQPLDDWIAEARRVGIHDFYTVEMDLCEPVTLDSVVARRSVDPGGITVVPLQIEPSQPSR